MIIEEKDGITFDNAVFERPSIKQILDDGKVSEQEIKQQTELTRRLFDELKNCLMAEQEEKLIVLMEEMGVLFAISLFHNLKKF